MSFEDGTIGSQASDDNQRKKQQRMAAMFGNRVAEESRDNSIAIHAVFPIGERVNLPMELIDEHPDNESVFNMDFIQELADVMSEDFYGAIEVYQKPNGRYEILAGHRRFRARKLNGEKTIPAIISEPPSEIERAKRLILSNIYNRELTPMDYAHCIDYYIKNVLIPSGFSGDKIKECSKIFMKSETHIKRYRALNKMIPELQSLLVNASFPFTALDDARTFTEEEQKQLYDEIQIFKKQNPETEVSQIYVKQIIHQINVKKGKKPLLAESQTKTVRDGLNTTQESAIEKKPDSIKELQPPVEFAAVPTERHIVKAEEESTETEAQALFETVLDAYCSQLNNINLSNYNTENREQILTSIYKLQDKLKYLESLFS